MSEPLDASAAQNLSERIDLAFAERWPGAMLVAPIFLGIGIGLYFSLKFEPELPLSAWFMLICLPAIAALMSQSLALRGVLIALVMMAVGLAIATWRTAKIAAPVLDAPFNGAVEGRFSSSDMSRSNRTRVVLDEVTLYGVEAGDTPKRVRVSLAGKDPLAGFKPGDRIMVSANLSGPGAPVEAGGFDFRRYAWFRQLGGVGFAMGPVVPALEQQEPGLRDWIEQRRYALAAHIKRQLPGDSGAFAAAILIGDRSSLNSEKLEDLRASNLAHLLAISGLHMGLVTGFVFAAARLGLSLRPGFSDRHPVKSYAALAAIGAGAIYLVFSGASIATQRAFIMAAIAFGAVVMARPALTLRAVAIAAFVILLMRPESLTEPGFQMSFAATTALVAVFSRLSQMPWWMEQRHGGARAFRWIAALVVSSATAGLATAPFGAFHFNQVAQYGLIANVLAVPIMGSMVMPALIIGLALAPIGLDYLPMQIAGAGIEAILWVAGWVAGFGGSVNLIPKGPPIVLALVSLGGLVLILIRCRARYAGVLAIAAALVIWHGAERPLLMIDPSARLVGVMDGGTRSLSKGRGAGLAATVWLENDADPADQKTAAARGFFLNEDYSVVALTGHGAAGDKISGLNKPPKACDADMVLITLKGDAPLSGACTVISPEFVARHGAVSVYSGAGTFRIHTARDAVGTRPWAPAP